MSADDAEQLVIHSETLDFNADCAEFCPLPGLTHLLALGTYQLVEETQQRLGRCYLRRLTSVDGGGGEPSGSAAAGSLDMPGIFDLKWRPEACGAQRRALLGAALADGTVRILEADAEEDVAENLRHVSEVAACSSGMALSLDWQVCADGGGSARIATSSSAGTLSLIQATNCGLSLVSEWEAHSLEAWCTAFHKAEGHVLFSGADDCYFKAYDIRVDPASPVFTDRRTHTAGVCTISPHAIHQHVVATGSYDEHVRLWDMRNISKPLVISQLNTGGGNWRLRWHPYDPHVLLAACMYNGFGVLRASEDFQAVSLVCMYGSPNQHIAYGADWWQERPSARGASHGGMHALAATCSFYDKLHTLVWLTARP